MKVFPSVSVHSTSMNPFRESPVSPITSCALIPSLPPGRDTHSQGHGLPVITSSPPRSACSQIGGGVPWSVTFCVSSIYSLSPQPQPKGCQSTFHWLAAVYAPQNLTQGYSRGGEESRPFELPAAAAGNNPALLWNVTQRHMPRPEADTCKPITAHNPLCGTVSSQVICQKMPVAYPSTEKKSALKADLK